MARILLIEDEHKTESRIREILSEHEITAAPGNADLVILDFDPKGKDGLQVLRQIRSQNSRLKVIVLSSANDISLAVAATKLGAADFIKKPIVAEQLVRAVRECLSPVKEAAVPVESIWLRGAVPGLLRALGSEGNIILSGERGIEKESAARFIHRSGAGSKRKFERIDLAAFRRENSEPHFWAAIKEKLAETPLRGEEDRCGTLFLENSEALDDNFRASVIDFFRSKKPGLDADCRVIIGTYEPMPEAKEYAHAAIPPLRDRKEDLPFLISRYIELFSARHGRKAKGISSGLLEFLAAYDFPGNFRELELLIEQAVLKSDSEIIDLKELALDAGALAAISDEYGLYRVLLSKTGGDAAAAARFLDVPRSFLSDRIEELAD